MKIDDFKKRYLIKVAGAFVVAIFNIVIQLILPRAFSIEDYGYYTYNLNIFVSVVSLANLSTSDAMVAKFSKRNDEIGIVFFYLKYATFMALLLCIGITILYPTDIMTKSFAGQTFVVVMMGFTTALINKLFTDVVSICDALAATRMATEFSVVMKVMMSLAVMVAFAFGRLNLILFYSIQISITVIVSLLLLFIIIKDQEKSYPKKKLSFKEYFKEYYVYCKPLVVAMAVSQVVILIMNWSLMRWSGASEQALFGAAWQLNTLVGYVFSPYAELLKREFAVLYDDLSSLRIRFEQALKNTIWLTAFFSLFIGIEADWILPIVYGDKYSAAYMVTLVIMLYTIHQSWGQIVGALMIGLEYSNVRAVYVVINQLLSLICVFVFQIPNFIWPNSLGSIGIGLNYFIVGLIMVNSGVVIMAKRLKMSSTRLLSIQMVPLFLCTLIPLVLKKLFSVLIPSVTIIGCIAKVLFSGLIYTVIIVAIIWIKPSIAGFSRESFSMLFNRKEIR